MSRIGNRELVIPEGVTITIDNSKVKVSGPKGELSTEINSNVTAKINENIITTEVKNEKYSNFHGTANAHIKNMIIGVTEGFEKKLESIGVGYRFAIKGNTLVVTAGFSHPVEVEIPEGINIETPTNTELIVKGINKQVVGEFAANIRKIRKPEPYKGKGIRYDNETVIRKVGKKAS